MPLYLPIGKEQNFKGLVNVLTGKAYMYKGDGSKEFTEGATRPPIWPTPWPRPAKRSSSAPSKPTTSL